MTGRRPAFDPARLADDLDELLPPPSPAPAPASTSARVDGSGQPTDGPQASEDAAPEPREAVEVRKRLSRGAGGRPPRSRAGEAAGPTVSAVRIPRPLYDAVVHDLLGSHVERPSYAQVVSWTCEDHAGDVLAELAHSLTAAARAPRGRRLAGDGVPLTLRFQPSERAALEAVLDQAGGGALKVTRTAGVIAALRVAVKHGTSAWTRS